jgi:hypothetical protein
VPAEYEVRVQERQSTAAQKVTIPDSNQSPEPILRRRVGSGS